MNLTQNQKKWLTSRSVKEKDIVIMDRSFYAQESINGPSERIPVSGKGYLLVNVLKIEKNELGEEICLATVIEDKTIRFYVKKAELVINSWRATLLSFIFIAPFFILYNLGNNLRKKI